MGTERTDQMSGLEVHGLTVVHDSFRLGPLDFSLPTGQLGVVVGPSGSGKSTLLEALCGLRPASGRIVIGGVPVHHLPPEGRQMALVPQDYALFPHLSVRSNILLAPRLRRMWNIQTQIRFHTLVSLLQLEHLLDKKPDQLSGGERQRVAIARALVLAPKLVLLDEPLAALDPRIRPPVRRSLKEIFRQVGATVLLVSHDPADAAGLADLVFLLEGGRLIEWGPWEQVIRNPQSDFLIEFLGINRVRGIVVRDGAAYYLQVGPARLRLPGSLPVGSPATVQLSPSQVIPLVHPTDDAVPVTVVERLDLGNRYQIAADLGDGTIIRVEGIGHPPASVGETLYITVSQDVSVSVGRG